MKWLQTSDNLRGLGRATLDVQRNIYLLMSKIPSILRVAQFHESNQTSLGPLTKYYDLRITQKPDRG